MFAANRRVARRTSRRTSRRMMRRQDMMAEASAPAEAAPAPAAPAAPPEEDMAAQLQELAKLKEQGILTEEEFTAKKQQILGI
jgi:Short C-terminal domain